MDYESCVLIDNEEKAVWWQAVKPRLEADPVFTELDKLERKIQRGACTVFLFDYGKTSVMVSPLIRGVFIDLVVSVENDALQRNIETFIGFLKTANYKEVSTRALTPSRQRLFERFGFEQDGEYLRLEI